MAVEAAWYQKIIGNIIKNGPFYDCFYGNN